MGGDTFETFPAGAGANNRERFREHQRRQHTIRMFMMFLMMLILMEGEESNDQRKNRDAHYLRRKKAASQLSNTTLSDDLFKRLRLFDAKLHRASVAHPRFEGLIQMNEGVNEENQVIKWAMEEFDKEKSTGKSNITKEPSKKEVPDEEAARLVYHYPRNVTGYYRGNWERLAGEENEEANALITKKSKKIENELIEGLNGKNDSTTLKISDYEEEIIERIKNRIGKEQESLGVFLLPPEFNDGNGTNLEKGDEFLTVTEPSGRAIFQLYSRPIPAIHEISLVDGFVKMYDVNNLSIASPNRNLFLRVRGVTIHSTGRISLVANDKSFRSALVVLKEEGREFNKQAIAKLETSDRDNNENRDNDENSADESNDKEHRRLLDSVSDVMNHEKNQEGYGSGEENDLVKKVRDNAIHLYDHYWSGKEIGGENWNEYAEVADYPNVESTLNSEDKDSNQRNAKRQQKQFDSHIENEPKLSDSNEMHLISHTHTRQLNEKTSMGEAELNSDEESSSIVTPPFVPDDGTLNLQKLPSFIEKSSISEKHFHHGLNCEFELNFDVQETKWSVGEWRTMEKRLMGNVRASDPSQSISKEANASSWKTKNFELADEKKRDEALVMNLIGTIESPQCDFASSVNMTAIRTDWEQATCKAINYSFYMMLACLSQIVLLLRQLLHTQAQSAATRVSMICVGWQAVLDAMQCVGHILLCMMMQPVFTAFAMVAFFKLLIFCVIEMKYMVIIMQARINADRNYSAEDLRRKIASLHARFYCALFIVLILFWTFIQNHRTLCLLALYSFWVPQIIRNIITEAKKPLHVNYIYGMSVTRLIAPLYMYAVPNNFFKEFFPEYSSDHFVCEMLFLWVGLQAGILIAQGKYGTRFMIPARFLPPKYDYHRPIPESLLPKQKPKEKSKERLPSDDVETKSLIGNGTKGPRNRKVSSRNGDESNVCTTIIENHDSDDGTSLDCVICYNSINIQNKRDYMLAPCDHIFHKDCLEQWMEVKMECPICRMALPPL